MASTIKESKRYVHYSGAPAKGKILMVVSSPAVSSQTGWPIGFWASELTHPLRVFQEGGYEVVIASTEGGKVEMDGYSDPTHESGYSAHDVITLGYLQTEWFRKALETTPGIREVNPEDYLAIYLVGGQGPMYTFRGNEALEKIVRQFHENGRPATAVCHATALLLEAKGSDGKLLINGKTWTGFANAEEKMADEAVGQKIQPFWIEDEARKIPDTTFTVAEPFSSYALRDGNLITGQQQNSGEAAAHLTLELLEEQ